MIPLADTGLPYAETNLGQFIVEPFNTVSNILFLFVALYWWQKKDKIQSPALRRFLTICLPLLLVGFIGGTIYHGTRSHLVWLLMDVLPIYLIAILTSFYHWRLLGVGPTRMALYFCVLLVLPLGWVWFFVPADSPHKPTLGYVSLAIPVVLPLVIDLFRLRGFYLKQFLVPLGLVIVALCFRSLDSHPLAQSLFPMGTHWLWHIFGAFTCHFLVYYMWVRSQYEVGVNPIPV
jgi:hypothetical protein